MYESWPGHHLYPEKIIVLFAGGRLNGCTTTYPISQVGSREDRVNTNLTPYSYVVEVESL